LGVGSILALNILETISHKKSGSIQKFKKNCFKEHKGKKPSRLVENKRST